MEGGSLLMAAAALSEVSDALVWGYDTFDGFETAPLAGPDAGHGLEREEVLRVSVETVWDTFRKYRVPIDAVRLVSGDINQTARNHDGEIAVLRLDVDLYDPTTAALTHLFPRVSPGGFVIVDDWNLSLGPHQQKLAQEATLQYLASSGLSVDFVAIDNMSIYFRKP